MKKYYHGTALYNAHRIFKEGFRLLNYYGSYGVKGPGLYLTDNKSYCFTMASGKAGSYVDEQTNHPCFIECELQLSNPILWVYDKYDEKVISYLKKEFSKRIDDPNYDILRMLPNNKHLTKKEIVNLVNYWAVKVKKERVKAQRKGPFNDPKDRGTTNYIDNTRKLLRRHGYSGWGQYTHDEWDSDEVVIFNPSEVKPKKCIRVTGTWPSRDADYMNVKLGEEVSLEEMEEAYKLHEEQIVSTDPEYGEDDMRELYR